MSSGKKSVLITGCAAGNIGGALAEAFLQKSYHVFATARTLSKLSHLQDNPNVTALQLDVTSAVSITEAVAAVKTKTGGTLDVLVNNSGAQSVKPLLDVSAEEVRRLFDVNFFAPLELIKAFAPCLIVARGCIVNNASINGVFPMAFLSSYNATKAALIAASETCRYELQPLGVRTITLMTCGVKTGSFDKHPDVVLPEDSRYRVVQGEIDAITSGSLQDGAISSKQYAEQVVHQVDGGATGKVWVGTNALVNRVAVTFSPSSVLDKIMDSVVPVSKKLSEANDRH